MPELHGDAGLLLVTFQMPVERGHQPEIIQHLRTEIDGELSHAFDQIVDEPQCLVKTLLLRRALRTQRGFQNQLQTGDRLADLVMQFTGEEPPLCFLHVHHAQRESLQRAVRTGELLGAFGHAPFQIIVRFAQRGFGEPDAKHGLHAGHQFPVLDRPGDVAIRAGFQPGNLAVGRGLNGREQDDKKLARFR